MAKQSVLKHLFVLMQPCKFITVYGRYNKSISMDSAKAFG